MRTRRPLPHSAPDFVSSGALYFLTICCQPRGRNQIAIPRNWAILVQATEHYHTMNRWRVHLFLGMPDHVHLIASFPADQEMRRVISAWKHFTHRNAGTDWQRDFFDHRLRNTDSIDEKYSYIRSNPVRAGLVNRAEDWPHIWIPSDSIALP